MTDIYQRRLRMAMIGGGPGAGIARAHRAAAYLDGEYELVAGAFSSDPGKSRQQGKALYIDPARAYGDWRDMLEKESKLPSDRRPDVIVVVTPNHLHHGPAKAALEHGFSVIMDKPMTMNIQEALDLREALRKSGKVFALTHTYGAAAMVKLARDLVKKGHLGKIKRIAVDYPQGWLHRLAEAEGNKAAGWRTDPRLAGSGCMGDIGTHAANLSETVSGLRIEAVAAEVSTLVEGRLSDDDFTALTHWEGGVKGSIAASQISTGEGNGLALKIYGDRAGLAWNQMDVDFLTIMYQDRPWERWGRNTPYANAVSPAAERVSRCYSFHVEGYLEEFANIYYNAAFAIRAVESGKAPSELELDFPGIEEGIRGMAFIDALRASSAAGGVWTKVARY